MKLPVRLAGLAGVVVPVTLFELEPDTIPIACRIELLSWKVIGLSSSSADRTST